MNAKQQALFLRRLDKSGFARLVKSAVADLRPEEVLDCNLLVDIDLVSFEVDVSLLAPGGDQPKAED